MRRLLKHKKILASALCLILVVVSMPLTVKADSYARNNNGTHQHSYSAYTNCGGYIRIDFWGVPGSIAYYHGVCTSCGAVFPDTYAGNGTPGNYHCDYTAEAPRSVMEISYHNQYGTYHNGNVWKTITVTEGCTYGPWSDWTVTLEPTCTTTGSRYKTRSCVYCGYVNTYTEVIPALGHIWTEESSEITTAPTPYATGIRTFTCCRDENHKTTGVEPALQFSIFNSEARITKIYLGDTLLDDSSAIVFTEPTGTAPVPTE